MNTVHLDPRPTGDSAVIASFAKSSALFPRALAKVCKNEPQPDEHASLRKISSMTPSLILKHFIS